jgi:Spy/CpxP family protein refolding chaperone
LHLTLIKTHTNMKANLMVVVAMLMSSLVFAQGHRNGGGHHGQHADKMKSVLSLTDEQYARVKSIDEKYAAKFSEFRKDSTARRENRDAMKSLRTQRESEIESVLTPEQNTKWDAHRAEQMKKHREKRRAHHAKMQEHMKSELNLTDDQESRLKSSNEKFRSKLKTWNDTEKKENHEEFKKYKAEHVAEVKSILTPEQFEKWKSIRKEKRKK